LTTLQKLHKALLCFAQELRRLRHEQRRGQWRLAKKLKNMQDQLVLMQVRNGMCRNCYELLAGSGVPMQTLRTIWIDSLL